MPAEQRDKEKREEDDTVRVALRVRPLIGIEKVQGCDTICSYPQPGMIVVGRDRAFTFDHVFTEDTPQDTVYVQCVHELVVNCMNGYNATIFAYGQTGSGKTFTMGTSSSAGVAKQLLGIVPRVVTEVFEMTQRAAQSAETPTQYKFKVVFLEIHNEEILDLLSDDKGSKSITIRESPEGEIYVTGVMEQEVSSAEEMLGCLEKGTLNRATGATLMNEHSSRSHAIFSVYVDQIRLTKLDEESAEVQEERLSSKFHFVDLAGSERLKRTGAVGERMREGISINSGLLALGNVISALSDPVQRNKHVPFRDSKITRLLQDSLGGNSKTIMIACVSPADVNFEETLNTLKYANRAKNIKNRAIINRDPVAVKMEAMARRIRELESALSASGMAIPADSDGAGGSGVATARSREENPFDMVFEPTQEEITFLKNKVSSYEEEIQRLTGQLKESRLQLSQVSDALLDVETERDKYRMRLKKASELVAHMKTPVDLGLGSDVNAAELDVIRSNLREMEALRKQINIQKLEMQQAQEETEYLRSLLVQSGMGPRVTRSPGDPFGKGHDSRDPSRRRRTVSFGGVEERALEYEPDALVYEVLDDNFIAPLAAPIDPEEHDMRVHAHRRSFGVETAGDLFSTAHDDSLDQLEGPATYQEYQAVQEAAEEQDRNNNEQIKSLNTLAQVKDREHTFTISELTERHNKLEDDIVEKTALMEALIKTRETAREMREVYETKIQEMEQEINLIESEKKEIEAMLKDGGLSPETGDMHRNRIVELERKLQHLTEELISMRAKLDENKKLQLERERDQIEITRLKQEIEQQKKEKAKLSKKIKDESEAHRKFMKDTEGKVKALEKQSRIQRISLQRSQQKLEKQGKVLERTEQEKEAMRFRIHEQDEFIKKVKHQKLQQPQNAPNAGARALGRSLRSTALARRRPLAQTTAPQAHEDIGEQQMSEMLEKLKEGINQEIERAVLQLDSFAAHQKLVKKREEAQEKLQKAEESLEDPAISPADEEYWQDTAEAAKSQIAFLNSKIVQLKVDTSKTLPGGKGGLRGVFNRLKVNHIGLARKLLLYLMDQVVNLRHEVAARNADLRDMQLRYDETQSEVKTLTRKSLMLQKTPSAMTILREIEEEEQKANMRRRRGKAAGAGDEEPVRHFLKALNVVASPEAGGAKLRIRIGEKSTTEGDAGSDADAASPKRHARTGSNAESVQAGGNIWSRLHTAHTTSSSVKTDPSTALPHTPRVREGAITRSATETGGIATRLRRAQSSSETRAEVMEREDFEQPQRDHPQDVQQQQQQQQQEQDDRDEQAELAEHAEHADSVFTRLLDPQNFTGMYKEIHAERPKSRGATRRTRSEKPRRRQNDSTDMDATETESVTSGSSTAAGSKPRGPPPPKPAEDASQAKPSALLGRTGGSEKDVFSRLLDPSSYTGMYRERIRDKRGGGGGGGAGRGPGGASDRDLEAQVQTMEKELEMLQSDWAQNKQDRSKRKQLKRQVAGGIDEKEDYSPSDLSQSSAASAPVFVKGLPNKQAALSAIRQLDSLFTRPADKDKQRSWVDVPPSQDEVQQVSAMFESERLQSEMSKADEEEHSSQDGSQKAHEVLNALAVVMQSKK